MSTIEQSLPIEQAKYSAEICTSIKQSMTKAGLTYEKLAEALGVPLHTAWNWLNGRATPPVGLLPATARLGLDEPQRKAADLGGYDVTPKFLRKVHAPARPVRSHALDIHHAAAALTMLLEDALVDQVIDSREQEALKAELFKVKKVLAEFEARIEGSGR